MNAGVKAGLKVAERVSGHKLPERAGETVAQFKGDFKETVAQARGFRTAQVAAMDRYKQAQRQPASKREVDLAA
jgi:hypothetical protein